MTQALDERRDALTARIEEGYSPARHLLGLLGVAAAACALAAMGLHRVTSVEAAVMPLAFLFANFGEWAVHRYVLHVRRWPTVAYDRHTRTHHAIYTHESFAIHSARELRFVLMPWIALVGMLVVVAPLAAALALAWSGNAARLFVLVAVGYYMLYEVLHTLYHLPEGTPVARSRLVQALAMLHRVHHDPSLMRRWNFNVTIPIADAALGTWRHRRDDRAAG